MRIFVFDKISHALCFQGMKEKFNNVNMCIIMVLKCSIYKILDPFVNTCTLWQATNITCSLSCVSIEILQITCTLLSYEKWKCYYC